MTVKRYSIDYDAKDRLAVKQTSVGDFVSYADYEAVKKEHDAVVAENAYLLPKAASELSNAWVLHKYWVGIQVALMHVRERRLHDGMVWLQNTISGPGIEAPELKEFSEIEAWAAEQQKDSIGHVRALEIIKAETPATDAALAEIRNEARAEGINYAAGRLAAAFNHGFVDKPLAEVFDVVRMILTAKENVAKETATDGLSGEYAETALKQWEEQLRKESGQ